MRLLLVGLLALGLALPVLADDYSGKTLRLKKDALNLSRKLVIQGEVVAEQKDLPKPNDKTGKPDAKDDWTGKSVLPKKRQSEIRIGDWKDGKQVFWKAHNLLNCTVREDRDGFLRVYDGHREGWVSKADFATAEDAVVFWDKAVKANAKDSYALNMRGACWMEIGEYDNAIKDYTEYIRIKPNEAEIYNMRGIAWTFKENYDEAIADYTEAIRLDPKYDLTYINRAHAWDEKQEYRKAVADYTEAIRLDPKHTIAYTNRGFIKAKENDYDHAIADLNEAIRLDPSNATAHYYRGIVWAKQKEYSKAIVDYTNSIRIYSQRANVYYYRGIAWAGKNEYHKAIADYAEAIRIEPKHVPSLNSLAWLKATCPDAKFRDGKQAVELAKKVIAVDSSWHCFDTLAAAYAENGDFELAVTEQRKAIEKLKVENPPDAEELKKAEARLALYLAKKPYRDE